MKKTILIFIILFNCTFCFAEETTNCFPTYSIETLEILYNKLNFIKIKYDLSKDDPFLSLSLLSQGIQLQYDYDECLYNLLIKNIEFDKNKYCNEICDNFKK